LDSQDPLYSRKEAFALMVVYGRKLDVCSLENQKLYLSTLAILIFDFVYSFFELDTDVNNCFW